MRNIISIVFLGVLLVFSACRGKNKDADVVYEYVEEVSELSAEMKHKIGSWAEEGLNCYGILALVDKEGNMQDGAVIKARIIMFKNDSVKMRSLSDVKLKEVKGCDKMGISRGQTWWETEGDIFQTKEEAESYLSAKLEQILE